MPELDRRTFLKTAAGSSVLVTPATLIAQSPQTKPGRPSAGDDTERRERAGGSGGLSKARLGRMHDGMAGYVDRGQVPGLVLAPPDAYPILEAANELQIGMGPPTPATTPAPDEWIRRLGTLPLMHQPGEMWMYNTGADVLSVLIARASGQRLRDFLARAYLRAPWHERHRFQRTRCKLDRLATSYWTNFKTGAVEFYDELKGQTMEPSARIPVRCWGARLNRRRLFRLRPNDAEPRLARQSTRPVQALR